MDYITHGPAVQYAEPGKKITDIRFHPDTRYYTFQLCLLLVNAAELAVVVAGIGDPHLEHVDRIVEVCEPAFACEVEVAGLALFEEDVPVNGLDSHLDAESGEVLLHALAQQEIYVSTGSACAAHKRGKNRVLGAMGVVGARQDGAIRFSLCPFNTLEEMDIAAEALAKQVTFLRRYQRR